MNIILVLIISQFILVCLYWFIGLLIAFVCTIVLKKKWDERGHKSYVPSPVETAQYIEKKHDRLKMLIRNFVDGYIRTLLRDVGNIHSHLIRNVIYKYIFKMNLSKNVVIYGGAEVRSPEKISIGQGSIVGDEAKLDGRNGIYLGKNVNLSTGVWIWTEQHDINSPLFQLSFKDDKSVVCEDRVWLGSRVVVIPGVHIGEGAVICSGAVVTKDCEAYGVYAGIPAKKIGNRNSNLTYSFDGKHYMFF